MIIKILEILEDLYMNENSIKMIIDDYTFRELQIYSSKILSLHESTNTFIKQFNSDHDSLQFYKNVIFWYIQKYKKLPDQI